MTLFTKELASLEDLYLHELRDLHSAEKRLIDSLPKMIGAASAPELQGAFSLHLEKTRIHLARLKEIFERIDEKPDGVTCEAMKGLLKESDSYIRIDADEHVRDAALIAAAQRIEHYEISGYGTARALARKLNLDADVSVLSDTLDEEIEADEELTAIAETRVNEDAARAY